MPDDRALHGVTEATPVGRVDALATRAVAGDGVAVTAVVDGRRRLSPAGARGNG
jgi:hypothetical protein